MRWGNGRIENTVSLHQQRDLVRNATFDWQPIKMLYKWADAGWPCAVQVYEPGCLVWTCCRGKALKLLSGNDIALEVVTKLMTLLCIQDGLDWYNLPLSSNSSHRSIHECTVSRVTIKRKVTYTRPIEAITHIASYSLYWNLILVDCRLI